MEQITINANLEAQINSNRTLFLNPPPEHVLEETRDHSRNSDKESEVVTENSSEERDVLIDENSSVYLRHKIMKNFEEAIQVDEIGIPYPIVDSVRLIKQVLTRIGEKLNTKVVNEKENSFLEEIRDVAELGVMVEAKIDEYKQLQKKEKRELESSLRSLSEENSDLSTFLRIAVMEKEAVEKRLKENNEQKRAALLQLAERGLQRVGFGFFMGAASTETLTETSSIGSMSDGSECEEGGTSLASTMEKMMKNMRNEVTELRISLEESRLDTEGLQILSEKQAQKIAENSLYMKELEERVSMHSHNIEELSMEMRLAEEEVDRWREAYENETRSRTTVIGERDAEIIVLRQELQKTMAKLESLNGKLSLKEELAERAMAARDAAERSLQLVDSRVAALREQVRVLTRQVEEGERNKRKSERVRHLCWPWRMLRFPSTDVPRRLPEMQAFLHHNI